MDMSETLVQRFTDWFAAPDCDENGFAELLNELYDLEHERNDLFNYVAAHGDIAHFVKLYEYIEKLEANQGEGASLVERSRWEPYKKEIDAEARIGGRVKALLDNPFDGFITVEYGNFSERANSVSELFATFRHLTDAGLVKFDP
jgi:hypothetical protein